MMSVHGRLATAIAMALAASLGSAAAAPAPAPATARDKSIKTETALTAATRPVEPGRLNGLVTDERGQALAGAAVTLAGAHLLFAVSDVAGRFQFERVQPG